jgi:arsenate reductase-like glutaredoxin family protein
MSFIYLDESGDLGFNPKRKNSKYFVITILATVSCKPIEKVVKKVHATLKKKGKRLSGGILHCYKEKPVTRKRLLRLLSQRDCSIISIYLNKSKVYTKLQDEKQVLYNYVTNILLDRIMSKRLINMKSDIKLIAAKRETNRFLNENVKDYLKGQVKGKHGLRIKIEIKTPAEEKALQAVDFVSWAIFRNYERGDNSYYNLIKERIVGESPLFP